MADVLQVRSNGQITLPFCSPQARGEGDLRSGRQGRWYLRLVQTSARSQLYFWTRRWQEGEREAEEDIQAGRVQEFEDIEDALSYLDERDAKA
jgi:hypothetical protein